MDRNSKNILFILLLALLVLPAVQHRFKFFRVAPLDGDFVLNQRPAFTWNTWMDGAFQAGLDSYLEDHIGFRNFFVRLNNQIEFSLFFKANAEGVVVGKNRVLFEYDYIRAYMGGDFIGKETLNKKLGRMKFLQEYLKEKFNINFLFILEPSKARFYPEYIPDRYLKDGLSVSNYEFIAQKVKEAGINHIDLNKYFTRLKDTTSHLLYPRYGIHWSEYSMSFISDTLVKTIENLQDIELPAYQIEIMSYGDSLSDSDYDVGKTMNLLWQLPHPEMAYPRFTFEPGKAANKPMVLAVADSYYWNFFNTRIPKNLFANEAFWYFNAKVYPDFYFGEKWVNQLDIKSEIEKQDIVLLSVTERFLYKFDWGFIDQVYNLYVPDYSGDIIYKYENLIRLDAQWFDRIQKEALKDNISLEEAIRTEARYQAYTVEPEIYLKWFGLNHFKEVISSNPGWKKLVEDKAAKNGITFEDQLTEDADYVFKTDYPEIHKAYKLIKDFKSQIEADPGWMSQVKEKADYYHMDLHSMIGTDAEYMARQKQAEPNPLEEKIKVFEELIRNDANWLESVRKKAEEQGKSTEQAIRDDAIYMAEQENKNK